MNLSGLLDAIQGLPAYRELLRDLEVDARRIEGSLGLLRAARPYLVAALAEDLRVPTLWIVARPEQVTSVSDQLRQWLPDPDRVLVFAEPPTLPYERIPWSADTVRERLDVLSALCTWQEREEAPPLVVTCARALMQYTLPKREYTLGIRTLRVGQRLMLTRLLATWLDLGYEMTSVVEEPGTFSRRGGILDIYSAHARHPVRIELFGDEVDSMRVFDPATQRSLYRVENWVISPATEALPKLGPLAVDKLQALDASGLHGPAGAEFASDLESLADGVHFGGIEFYIPYLYSHPGTLLDYLPPQGMTIVDDMVELVDAVGELEEQALELQASLQASGELLPGYARSYVVWDELREMLTDRRPLHLSYDGTAMDGDDEGLGAHFRAGPRYGGQLRTVMEEWMDQVRGGARLVAITRQARRLADLWNETPLAQEGPRLRPVDALNEVPEGRGLTLVQGTLDAGWMLLSNGTSAPPFRLLTDAEIFGWSKPRPRRLRRKPAHPEVFYADLNPGDYVVHVDFGIGLFQGLTKATIDGIEREYLRVDYAGEDSVYVPIHHADRLSRYVGATERTPVVHRLGTQDWARVKERAKKAAVDIAKDLLALYAARQVVPGHAFAADTEWQDELEASFPYIETEDQLRSIEEVKADMEKPVPMDRLLCGDVGYGKTEVSLRAAFKAVMDGKQVAVLVPTTVLAQQHYTTFMRRLAPFPVRVEMLSRFRTARDQHQVVRDLSAGSVDIVVGTHRILSQDVEFKDLGLLIIDEEQRFGVTHKERLKQMRTEVDVLTMTATPIPRTLYMSLVGARDMSTIDTPPEERLPIKTHVGEYDETLIRTALLRELDRGGQVFFVHNRVRGIRQIRQRLEQLVPEANYAVGHGQMPERELENVMVDFAEGNIDVLVCTTIIENGLDIPNANTIIVNRADRFGLSQLYQLRGRVGRGANRAYAYLMYDRSGRLTDTAHQRLEAMMEASDLGAGFTVAMRDLEIRGAGEILGARQHGQIAAVGFDLYSRLLAQSVSELKGESPRTLTKEVRAYTLPLEKQVQITLPLDANLPPEYITDEALRLQLYRRLSGMTTLEEIQAIAAELEDRFGPLPELAQNLLYQLRLKALAIQAEVEVIVAEHRELVIRSEGLEDLDRAALQHALGARIKVRRREVRLPLGKEEVWRAELARTLEAIRDLIV